MLDEEYLKNLEGYAFCSHSVTLSITDPIPCPSLRIDKNIFISLAPNDGSHKENANPPTFPKMVQGRIILPILSIEVYGYIFALTLIFFIRSEV